ncbi:MAG: cyclic nucleotide-binding domain-containing protein [bacterium]|nr:cyclic nucleotide-binding domain-containing protein [bacterium]
MGADDKLFEKFGKSFPAGTVLFQDGSAGQEMYIIQSGKVKISKKIGNLEKTLAILPTGDFFGEMSILNNRPRSATATVMEDANLLVIDPKTFETMLRNNAEIAIRIIKKLAARLQDTDNQIESLLLKNHNQRVVLILVRWAEARGKPENQGIRVGGTEQELETASGVEANQLAPLWDEIAKAGVARKDEKGYFVPDLDKLKKYLDYLSMKEQFGG